MDYGFNVDDQTDNPVANALKALQALGLQAPDSTQSPEQNQASIPPTTSVPSPASTASTNSVIDSPKLTPTNVKPILTSPTLKPQKFGDVGGATTDVNKSLNEQENSDINAVDAKLNAERAKSDRLVQVQSQYVKDLGDADANYQQKLEMVHKQSAAETADWMKDMDKRASEKPDHSHWWHNSSLFSKALWLTSVAFSTMAESKGGHNVAKDMISQSIDEDMKEQSEAIQRKFATGKEKGQMLEKTQAQREGEVRDFYTHQVGRINALLAANTVRAQGVSDDDKKAAYAAVDADLRQRKTAIAAKRLEDTTHERLKQVEEAHADTREIIKEKFEAGQNDLNRKMHYDLAEESIQAKLDAADKKAKNKQDLHEFPIQSGVKIRVNNAQGQPVDATLAIPKDQAKEASEIVRNGQAKVVALAGLRDAVKDKGLPYGVFSNDNEGRQRLAALVDPLIKQMSGRFNKDTAKAMNDMIMGEDPSSIWQRVKGLPAEDIVKMLDREIQESNGATKQQLLGIPGSNLADHPDAELVFTAPDTRGPKEHEYTGDEKIVQATGTSPDAVQLRNKEDISNFGTDAEKQMPSELHDIVNEVRTRLAEGFDKDTSKKILIDSNKRTEKWLNNHPGQGGFVQQNNADRLIDDVYDKAVKAADELPNIRIKLTKEALLGHKVTIKDIKEELDENNLTLSSVQMQKLLDDIDAAKKRPFTGDVKKK